MSTLEIINAKKSKVGQVTLNEAVTEGKINQGLLHQAVRRYLAGHHHGTVDTKTRAEVLRTTKKVYRQKGTGNARHGSRKSAPFVGGGRVFGPHPRDYSLSMNKKTARLTLREALRNCLQEGKITLLDAITLPEAKTKKAIDFFSSIGIEGGLIVVGETFQPVHRALRNTKFFKVIRTDQLNVFDLLAFPRVVFSAQAFEEAKKRYLD